MRPSMLGALAGALVAGVGDVDGTSGLRPLPWRRGRRRRVRATAGGCWSVRNRRRRRSVAGRDAQRPSRSDQVRVGEMARHPARLGPCSPPSRRPVRARTGDLLLDVPQRVAGLDAHILRAGRRRRAVRRRCGCVGGQREHRAGRDLVVRSDRGRVELDDLRISHRVTQMVLGDRPQGVAVLHLIGRCRRRVSGERRVPATQAPGEHRGGDGVADVGRGDGRGDRAAEVTGQRRWCPTARPAVAAPAISGATVKPTAIAATSAAAGRWKTASPGSGLAGRVADGATISGISDSGEQRPAHPHAGGDDHGGELPVVALRQVASRARAATAGCAAPGAGSPAAAGYRPRPRPGRSGHRSRAAAEQSDGLGAGHGTPLPGAHADLQLRGVRAGLADRDPEHRGVESVTVTLTWTTPGPVTVTVPVAPAWSR